MSIFSAEWGLAIKKAVSESLEDDPPVPEGFQREIDAGRMRQIGWKTYMVVPFHREDLGAVSGCFPTVAENPVLQGTLEAILDEPKPTICPCGIHREDCEYHR